MNELLREIEEDIRQERLDKLWHSFGRVMVGASLAVILATVAVVIFQNHRQSEAMEHTSQFIKAADRINIEDYKSAIPLFSEIASDPGSPYYGLAMLRKAQSQKALGDKEGAGKTYQELAEHDPVFGPLAQLLAPAAAGKVIEPSTTSPFYFTQSEWRAWQLLKEGKKDEAVKQFLTLYQGMNTPRSMRQRVVEVLRHIAPDKIPEDNPAIKVTAHE